MTIIIIGLYTIDIYPSILYVPIDIQDKVKFIIKSCLEFVVKKKGQAKKVYPNKGML